MPVSLPVLRLEPCMQLNDEVSFTLGAAHGTASNMAMHHHRGGGRWQSPAGVGREQHD